MEIHLKIGGVPEHFNLPWLQSIEQGSFLEKGIALHWTDYPQGTGAMVSDLQTGKLDVAVLLTEGIVKEIINGNPSRIVGTYIDSPLHWGVHVSTESEIDNVDKIKGKKFAVSRLGSGSHLMAYIHAAQKNWKFSDSNLEIVGNIQGGLKAIREGSADVFLWEKYMTKPYLKHNLVKCIDEILTPWACFMIAVREEVLEKQPLAIMQILEVIKRNSAKFMRSPQTIQKVSEHFRLEMADVAEWFGTTKWNTTNTVSGKDLHLVSEVLANLKFISQKPPLNAIVDTRFCEIN